VAAVGRVEVSVAVGHVLAAVLLAQILALRLGNPEPALVVRVGPITAVAKHVGTCVFTEALADSLEAIEIVTKLSLKPLLGFAVGDSSMGVQCIATDIAKVRRQEFRWGRG